jgi:hypothetical protein
MVLEVLDLVGLKIKKKKQMKAIACEKYAPHPHFVERACIEVQFGQKKEGRAIQSNRSMALDRLPS